MGRQDVSSRHITGQCGCRYILRFRFSVEQLCYLRKGT